MSPLHQPVNFFPKSAALEGTLEYYGQRIILGEVLRKMHTSRKHIEIINTLRALPYDSEEQRLFKKRKVPCFTISGYFEKDGRGSRKASDIIQYTSAIGLDLDPKDPSANLKALKQQIKREPFVSYVGDSCRGEGIFVIIHVAEPEKHLQYFEFFLSWLERNGCKGTFDKQTKNINRLRYVAPDPDSYLNYDTIPLRLPKIQQRIIYPVFKKSSKEQFSSHKIQDKIGFAVRMLNKQGKYFVDDYKHDYLYNLCCLLNKIGVSQEEAETYIATLIPLAEVKSNCISYPYKTYASEFGSWRADQEKTYTIKPYRQDEVRKTREIINQKLECSASGANHFSSQDSTLEKIHEKKPIFQYGDKHIPAYVDPTGKLYIKTPTAPTYSIYPSIDHYNKRLCVPKFQNREDVNIDNFEMVYVDLNTLTISE